MGDWEFLIQQEGDQTWLPLEAKQVEILEGRYRLAAHTGYVHKTVDIRVSQLLFDEMPPRRRVRKRQAATNEAGLLAIFPYIQLAAGRWDIDCSSTDVMDDMFGDGWHYSVQLQVLPREDDSWGEDWPETDVAEQGPPNQSRIMTDLAAAVGEEPGGTEPTEADSSPMAGSDFRLELKQQTYVAQSGQAILLTGRIYRDLGTRLADSRIRIQLRDPQTGKLLDEKRFPLPAQGLPAPFAVEVFLPTQLSTQVILGAATLQSGSGSSLASVPFTVTTGLAQMLDAIAAQASLEFEEEVSVFPGSTHPFVAEEETSDVVLTSEIPTALKELAPSEGLTLPPQLTAPAEAEVSAAPEGPPELPTFPQTNDIDPDESLDSSQEVETNAGIDHQVSKEMPGAAPTTSEPPTPEELDTPTEDQGSRPEKIALDTIDRSFRALRLQERFWEKLMTLTREGYRHALEVKRAMKTGSSPPPPSTSEFVLEPAPTPRPSPPAATTEPVILPAPQLDIPYRELTAGDWISIRVRLAPGDYRPYIKVWMNDLQTRTVVDAPRLLMQLIPNDEGELEAMMRLQIPTGCLELQFAAIAIDMETLQESRKVVQNRRVLPPSDLSVFDDLGL